MNQHPSTVLYGSLPASLMAVPADAVQCSPLVPGAAVLEQMREVEQLFMLAPAGTIERRYALALALRALKPGGAFTILAPRDKGGARLGKELAQFGCVVQDDSKQHHRICTGTRPHELHGIDDALNEGAPRFVEALDLWSQPGVFSWDRMDTGSALLVEHLPPLTGAGADFGGGIGYLSRAVLASPAVTQLSMLELDRRAVAMAAKNVTDPRAAIRWADVRQSDLHGLDFVVMNPPFHDGGIEDRTLGTAFITRAAQSLRSGGTCWLVANRHLPYEAVMKPLFARVTLHTETAGFKIYEAVK